MAYADDWGGADPHAHGRARRLFLMSSLVGMTPVIRRLIPDLGCRRMAFIPTASYAADYGVANRLMHWWWRALGVDVHVVDLTDARRWRIHDELRRAGVFYVCGGNTFYLMHCLQSSGAAGIIRERVAQGVPYLGESAGAVAAAPSIDYIAPMDERPAIAGNRRCPCLVSRSVHTGWCRMCTGWRWGARPHASYVHMPQIRALCRCAMTRRLWWPAHRRGSSRRARGCRLPCEHALRELWPCADTRHVRRPTR